MEHTIAIDPNGRITPLSEGHSEVVVDTFKPKDEYSSELSASVAERPKMKNNEHYTSDPANAHESADHHDLHPTEKENFNTMGQEQMHMISVPAGHPVSNYTLIAFSSYILFWNSSIAFSFIVLQRGEPEILTNAFNLRVSVIQPSCLSSSTKKMELSAQSGQSWTLEPSRISFDRH
jgi:hypothetical protein